MSSGPAARGADLEAVLRDFFAGSGPDIVAVYLFGSQARGTARADSDVDVAILYDRQPPVSLEGLLDRYRAPRS